MGNQRAQHAYFVSDSIAYREGAGPAERLNSVLSASYDRNGETSEGHRDRLFLQVLISLTINVIALIGIFHFLLPLSDNGRATGGLLLCAVLITTVGITFTFLKFGMRTWCVNLLLLMLSAILFGASFILGGVMSPTMIFLLAMPVLAVTLMDSRWAFFWTALIVVAWLTVLVLEKSGVEMTRITYEANVGIVQVLSLSGTFLIVMAVLGSYVAANSRLRVAMEQKTDRLEYIASHDGLTSIPNRRSFFDHAQGARQRADRLGRPFAMLVIDLNDFKQINDKLGHKIGDGVLQHFAQRLDQGFRESDFVGRLGGDEFGVVLEPAEDTEGVNRILERFHASGENTIEVDGCHLQYSCAIGIALYPEDGSTVLAMYEAADAAMYRSKRGMPRAFIWK